jgi:arginase family enzyme
MTGYESKRAAARDKLEDDDTQVYQDDTLTIAYQSGYYDGKKAAQPAQEPFGYFRYDAHFDAWVQNCENNQGTPFYTAPPHRPWVGLTWEEIDECFKITPDQYLPAQIYKRIEAKLKEKNNG